MHSSRAGTLRGVPSPAHVMTIVPIPLDPVWASSDKLAGNHLVTGFTSP